MVHQKGDKRLRFSGMRPEGIDTAAPEGIINAQNTPRLWGSILLVASCVALGRRRVSFPCWRWSTFQVLLPTVPSGAGSYGLGSS